MDCVFQSGIEKNLNLLLISVYIKIKGNNFNAWLLAVQARQTIAIKIY